MTEIPLPSESSSASTRWNWKPRLRWFAAEIAVVVAGVLIALALFLVVKAYQASQKKKEEAAEATEVELLTEIRDLLSRDRVADIEGQMEYVGAPQPLTMAISRRNTSEIRLIR